MNLPQVITYCNCRSHSNVKVKLKMLSEIFMIKISKCKYLNIVLILVQLNKHKLMNNHLMLDLCDQFQNLLMLIIHNFTGFVQAYLHR
jgi:hypothetical protein